MDMCVVKVMPGKEKSQKRVAEHSVNNLQEVLTILPVSITNTSPAASQRPSVETSSSNSAFEKGVLKDDAVKSTNSKGQCRLSASLKVNSRKSSTSSSVRISTVPWKTLITVINVAVSSSIDKQKLLVIVQSRQSGDDDNSELSALAGAVTLR